MPTFRFIGIISPRAVNLTMFMPLDIQMSTDKRGTLAGLKAIFWLGIKNSEVEVECESNMDSPDVFHRISISAFELARSAVDLVAFSRGQSITVTMEKAITPDGKTHSLLHGDQSLSETCTAFNTTDGSLIAAVMLTMRNPSMMLALNDVVSTLEVPHRTRINCARAVEAIGRMISPEEPNSKRRWKRLQDALNISQAYLQPLSEESAGPRHGNYFEDGSVEENVLRKKAWVVMNRFLEYLKRDSAVLTEPDFPVLS
jgi:hypothetical protein